MPTARARKLCPKLIVVPGDYERYEQFSNWMFGYPVLEVTATVEPFENGRGFTLRVLRAGKPRTR
jgi:hypothetical protein